MKFPYWAVQGQGSERYAPLVPVTAHTSETSVDILALVDSGADHTIFGVDVADRLGISLNDAQSVTVVGIGDQPIPGHLIDVSLQIGNNRWTAPVIFTRVVRGYVILGREGFFAFFTVTFRHAKRQLEIQRVRKSKRSL